MKTSKGRKERKCLAHFLKRIDYCVNDLQVASRAQSFQHKHKSKQINIFSSTQIFAMKLKREKAKLAVEVSGGVEEDEEERRRTAKKGTGLKMRTTRRGRTNTLEKSRPTKESICHWHLRDLVSSFV